MNHETLNYYWSTHVHFGVAIRTICPILVIPLTIAQRLLLPTRKSTFLALTELHDKCYCRSNFTGHGCLSGSAHQFQNDGEPFI